MMEFVEHRTAVMTWFIEDAIDYYGLSIMEPGKTANLLNPSD